MEILSPVGAKEQLYAAVRSGADAVYLGLKDFNARRNANNFSDEELETAIKYAHARNVKVYITLNTLVKESELEKAICAIKEAAKFSADAIIVQDLAIYRLAKKIVPSLSLHASTQMSIHNAFGVKVLEELGFSRVVPARELSLEELKRIRGTSNIELEVFVHGALCMCISGQCYLSSILGARSANRGLCAQPCRLNFKSNSGDFALSLKDLSVIKDLKVLEDIGIDSAKIEGRMKRPEYVYAATKACKDSLFGKEFDSETLKSVFSRSGFTDGYLYNKRDRDMFGYRTKEDVVSAAPILKSISNDYRNEAPLIAVDMEIIIKKDFPVILNVYHNKIVIRVEGPCPEKAINRSLDGELVKRSLEKCGGTPYYLNNLKCDIEEGLSLSASAINSLRKSALEQLEQKLVEPKPHKIYDYSYKSEQKQATQKFEKQLIFARFEKAEQVADGVDKIILDYEQLCEHPEICKRFSDKLIAELPTLMFNEVGAEEKILRLKSMGINTVYAPNLYAIHLAKKTGMNICGGFGLNILNSVSLLQYMDLGLDYTEFSFETSLDNFKKVNKSIPCGLIAYGKMPLMTFRNCPAKTKAGCGDCNCKATILDRYNSEFTVMCKNRKYSRLLNPNPIYMGDKLSSLKSANFLTLYFTDESSKECVKIIESFKKGKPFGSAYTRGLYFKEIF